MKALILKTEPNSRNRLEICRKFQQLAEFAKLEADFLKFSGSYGLSKVRDRDVLSDRRIAEQWANIVHKPKYHTDFLKLRLPKRNTVRCPTRMPQG